MGDYNLYMKCNKTQEEYANYLQHIYNDKLNEVVKLNKYEDCICLCLFYQTIFIHTDEIFGLDWLQEYHEMDIDVEALFDISPKYHDYVLESMFKLVKEIVKTTDYDLVLTDIDQCILLKKVNGKYSSQAIGRTVRLVNFPFEIFDMEIEDLGPPEWWHG